MKLHLYLLDAASALVIATLSGYAMLERQSPSPWLVVPLAALIGLPVAVRRFWPFPALGISAIATVTAVVTHTLPVEAAGAPAAALCFAIYTIAVDHPRGTSLTTAVAAALVTVPTGSAIPAAALAAIWVIGYLTRLRRATEARAATQLAEQALTDERLRIARELHDIVAHNLSLIAVQASTAAHVRSPEDAYEALDVIAATSRDALSEMRHLLGVLRSDAALAPAPGLAGLPELVERAAMAGVRVTLEMQGDTDVPEGVGMSAYRIVQEAVTNVIKHAAPARCTARVEITPDVVRVEVTDDGPGSLAPMGHGLLGMRERVAVYDGTFEAGPLAAGGFRVRAELPYR
ncbi:two-component sensor histidine kinase [Lentzea sp. NBRC 105346]|uniref:sensor histidine kinase n=1 Tax=Lentzea sp. NBRC 105346 TaxID=3032205 RepID=UPI0024A46B07|nr:histidine kinase [Lentzea sp. NBRC 105346]GLZ31603.1 two-component sensor histidine kinase [Lentzea sp. NBRC 105346]